MSTDPLLARARTLWRVLASVPVEFSPEGGVNVAVAPGSLMCPVGWVGFVALGGSAIATAPDVITAARVRAAVTGVPIDKLADPEVLSGLLRVNSVLGPAALAYVSPQDFRPAPEAAAHVEQLPADDAELRALEAAAGEQDATEAGIGEITSPAFVVREKDEVVAACGYRLWPGRAAHISVLTSPAWRGRGLARATASATVEHALDAGLLPQWRARVPAASRRVALALGFQELGFQLSLELAAIPAA